MTELLFGGNAAWFGVPALVGTLFFLVRLVMLLAVGGHGFDLHDDSGAGISLDHPDSSTAFKVLSVQTVSAFLMGFGWGGLGVYRGFGLPAVVALPAGLAMGYGMVWLLTRMFTWIAGFQSSGTMDTSAALYEEGTVYVTVPARRSGRGTVRVVVADRQQYYQAVTEGDAIPSQAAVRVTQINDDNTLNVERVLNQLPPAGA